MRKRRNTIGRRGLKKRPPIPFTIRMPRSSHYFFNVQFANVLSPPGGPAELMSKELGLWLPGARYA